MKSRMCKYLIYCAALFGVSTTLSAATADSKKFATPREAVSALERALSRKDLSALRDAPL